MATLSFPSTTNTNYVVVPGQPVEGYTWQFEMTRLRSAPSDKIWLPRAVYEANTNYGQGLPLDYEVFDMHDFGDGEWVLFGQSQTGGGGGYWTYSPSGGYWNRGMTLRLDPQQDPQLCRDEWVHEVSHQGNNVLYQLIGDAENLPITSMALNPEDTIWDQIAAAQDWDQQDQRITRSDKWLKRTNFSGFHGKFKYPTARPVVSTGRLMLDDTPQFVLPNDLFYDGVVRIGLTEDHLGYTRFRHRWSSFPSRMSGVDHAEREFLVPWNRVYIHRADDCWRFLFVLQGRVYNGGLSSGGACRSCHHMVHLFSVRVFHYETGTARKTWPGLTNAQNEAINSVPGMASAMSHALNTLKAKSAAMRDQFMCWPKATPPMLKWSHGTALLNSAPNGLWNHQWDYQMNYGGRNMNLRLEEYFRAFRDGCGPNSLTMGGQPVASAPSKRMIEL